ncbi:hypothetical protein BsWGS_22518 [Bradybaena similaris]
MSVLKKLKGTFQHAQQDFVDGLRSLTSLDNNSRHDPLHSFKAREISLDTGADLLHCYQKNWSSIQTETRESAKKAEEASALMTPLLKIWEKHAESLSHLEQEVKAIPSILTMLTQLHTLLDGLSQSFIEAGRGLDILEDLCEEQEFHRKCLEEQRKLAMYKVQKEGEAERVKVELAQAHAKKMVEMEAAKRKSLQERADAFTSAFQNDLEFYRAHGHPGKLPVELPKVASLSEIVLDQDKQALDSFLGPSTEPEGSTGSLSVSGDGSYIEDDYTNDFSVKQDIDFQDDGNHEASLATAASLSDEDADGSITGIDPESTNLSDQHAYSGDHNHTEHSEDADEVDTENINSSGISKLMSGDIDEKDITENREGSDHEVENVATHSQNTDIVVT